MLTKVEAQAAAIDAPALKPGTTLNLLNALIPTSYVLDLRWCDPGADERRNPETGD